MAENWGLTLKAADVARVMTTKDFVDLVADALTEHNSESGKMRGIEMRG